MIVQKRRTQPLLCLIIGGVLIGFILLISFGSLFIRPDRISARYWRGYYTVFLEELSRELAISIQSLPGIMGIVSQYTSEVAFNTFEGFETVEISRLDKRLDAIDPRFDPYMKSVPKYFRTEQGRFREILYIRSDLNRAALFSKLQVLLAPRKVKWRLLEFDLPARTLQFLLFIIFFITVTGLKKQAVFNLLDFLGLLPWLIKLLTGDHQDLIAFFLIYPVWILLLEEVSIFLKQGSSGRIIIFRFVLFMSIFLLVNLFLTLSPFSPGTAPRLPISNLWALGANLLLIPLCYFLFIYRKSRHFHLLFEPLLILQGFKARKRLLDRQRLAAALLIIVALVSMPLVMIEKKMSGLSIPLPQRISRREGITWAALERLSVQNNKSLPDLSDYITHRAFHEGLSFGRLYRFPAPGERIYISSYRNTGQDGRILKTFRVVKQYKISWLAETLARAPVGSVQGLLLEQQAPVRVVIQEEARLMRESMPGWKILLISIFLLSSLCLWDFHLTPFLLYGTRILALKRKRQAV
ncbi:hypothetical protein ES703_36479 [subsurface metagenome]